MEIKVNIDIVISIIILFFGFSNNQNLSYYFIVIIISIIILFFGFSNKQHLSSDLNPVFIWDEYITC